MKPKEFDEKVELLRAGQVVEIDGHYFRAKSLQGYNGYLECHDCCLDSLCKGDIPAVCTALSTFKRMYWLLELVDGKN